MNTINDNSVVEIDYVLKDDEGEILDSSKDEGSLFFIMGKKNIIPGLESEIATKSVGDSFQITVEPKDAYGERIEAMVQSVPKAQFGEDADKVQLGNQFQVEDKDGQPLVVQVVEINNEVIVLDANHPLAGETLHFDVTILSSREPTSEELERGYPISECDENGGCC